MKERILTAYEAERVVEKSLDIGEAMIKTGAEITRVEDSIRRICKAYSGGIVDVFSIMSLIVVTLHTTEDRNITLSRRIYTYQTDLGKLEQLNALSRYICQNLPCIDEIDSRMQKIMEEKKGFSIKIFLGYLLAVPSFALFFGGNMRDGMAALLVAAVFYVFECFFKGKSSNKVIYIFMSSFVVGVLTILSVKAGIGQHIDKIMIGNIMLLIPGINFMNSVKDMLSGDTISGLLKLLESIMLAVAIAAGYAAALLLSGQYGSIF